MVGIWLEYVCRARYVKSLWARGRRSSAVEYYCNFRWAASPATWPRGREATPNTSVSPTHNTRSPDCTLQDCLSGSQHPVPRTPTVFPLFFTPSVGAFLHSLTEVHKRCRVTDSQRKYLHRPNLLERHKAYVATQITTRTFFIRSRRSRRSSAEY